MNYFVNHKFSSDYFRKDYNSACTGIRPFKNKNLKKYYRSSDFYHLKFSLFSFSEQKTDCDTAPKTF